jgi:hypothetical protein
MRRLELENPMLQDVLVEVRAWNGFAGWKCPEAVSIYQAIARELQGPLDWHNLSKQTKGSMNDYLLICREMGVVGAELLIQMDATTTTVDLKTGVRHVEMTRKHADPQSMAIVKAIEKISNPTVREELLRNNMASRAVFSLGNRHNR